MRRCKACIALISSFCLHPILPSQTMILKVMFSSFCLHPILPSQTMILKVMFSSFCLHPILPSQTMILKVMFFFFYVLLVSRTGLCRRKRHSYWRISLALPALWTGLLAVPMQLRKPNKVLGDNDCALIFWGLILFVFCMEEVWRSISCLAQVLS